MTAEQAIEIIEEMKDFLLLEEERDYTDALNLAIAALNKRPYSREEVREAVATQIKGCL